MQWQLHFQYCILYIFVKRLQHNFYSVTRNSKIISPRNFTFISLQNTAKESRGTYFQDDPRNINIENIDIENGYRNNIDILGVGNFEEKGAFGDESRGFEYFLFNNFFEKKYIFFPK